MPNVANNCRMLAKRTDDRYLKVDKDLAQVVHKLDNSDEAPQVVGQG